MQRNVTYSKNSIRPVTKKKKNKKKTASFQWQKSKWHDLRFLKSIVYEARTGEQGVKEKVERTFHSACSPAPPAIQRRRISYRTAPRHVFCQRSRGASKILMTRAADAVLQIKAWKREETIGNKSWRWRPRKPNERGENADASTAIGVFAGEEHTFPVGVGAGEEGMDRGTT